MHDGGARARAQLLAAGVTTPLYAVIASENEALDDARRVCFEAMREMLRDKNATDEAATFYGCVPMLLEHVKDGAPRDKPRAMECLANLAIWPAGAAALAKHTILPDGLLEIMTSDKHERATRSQAVLALTRATMRAPKWPQPDDFDAYAMRLDAALEPGALDADFLPMTSGVTHELEDDADFDVEARIDACLAAKGDELVQEYLDELIKADGTATDDGGVKSWCALSLEQLQPVRDLEDSDYCRRTRCSTRTRTTTNGARRARGEGEGRSCVR